MIGGNVVNMTNVAENLEKTSQVLRKYGFDFWANKLDASKSEIGQKSETEIINSLKKLYGGFGTLMDLAVDPYELPKGVTEEAGNKELIGSINDLHRSLG